MNTAWPTRNRLSILLFNIHHEVTLFVVIDFRLGTDLKDDKAIVRFKIKNTFENDIIEIVINDKVVEPIKKLNL